MRFGGQHLRKQVISPEPLLPIPQLRDVIRQDPFAMELFGNGVFL